MQQRRLGRFVLYDEIDTYTDTDLQEIFSHFVILRAEHRPERRCFAYLAASPLFAQVPSGEVIPEYEIEVSGLRGAGCSVLVRPHVCPARVKEGDNAQPRQ